MQNALNLSPAQQEELAAAINKIAAATNADRIHCYGYRSTQKTAWSPFNTEPSDITHHVIDCYDLLLVMDDNDTGFENRIADIVGKTISPNTSFTYRAFTRFAFNNLLRDGHPFIYKVDAKGATLHDSERHAFLYKGLPCAPLSLNTTNLHWTQNINMARQAQRMAQRALLRNERGMTLRHLEAAASHACMALVTLYTGHRQRTQMLGQLLKYCDNFCGIRARVFPGNTPEETQLLHLLELAVVKDGKAYKEDIPVHTVETLVKRIQKMLALADWLYKVKTAAGIEKDMALVESRRRAEEKLRERDQAMKESLRYMSAGMG